MVHNYFFDDEICFSASLRLKPSSAIGLLPVVKVSNNRTLYVDHSEYAVLVQIKESFQEVRATSGQVEPHIL